MPPRTLEAGACFALGATLAIAASLGGQSLERDETPTVVALPRVEAAPPPPAEEVLPAPEPVVIAAPAPAAVAAPGARLGRFELTRYYVVDESKARVLASTQGDLVTLYDDRACEPIATLPRRFVRELDMEGTGRLRDGRTINVSKECGCGRSPCYRVTGADARWGLSARGEPLEPFRTVAVDPDVIPLGTHLYIEELDGLTMPGPPPWGGFVHDGCVTATDVGGRIRGRHVDFFVGRQVHKKAFDARWSLERVTVYRADGRCGRVARDSGS